MATVDSWRGGGAIPGSSSANVRRMDQGIYESLLTERLAAELAGAEGVLPDYDTVDDTEQPLALARHLAPIIEHSMRGLRSVEDRQQLVRDILAVLPDTEAPEHALHPHLPGRISRLEQIVAARDGGAQRLPRPATPFSDAALMTNARNEPNLAAELRAELATADHVDLLCAFVKWHGLRVLENELKLLRERGIPLRVITTTYLGATDARALDALVNEFGAEVRINYETDHTRLHAKAWLLRRNTGFHTAYVGSSNLSHAALVDGLEWNVRLSAVSTPHLLEKFRATFDSYWTNRAFELYRPEDDGERLTVALEVASGTRQRDTTVITLSGLEVTPKPFQAEILEQLDAERSLHDRHRNLVVAATGTGKTVIAALDYRRLLASANRDLRLLFVAHRKEILQQARRMYQEVLSDATFGELLVDGNTPTRWTHVFASVQSLSAARLATLDPAHFDVVVIDEFHHAEAASYRRLLDHVRPKEMLGLTATPERSDGTDVRSFFGGRVAAELRLWDALEQDLLCPFQYFGIYDGTDLARIAWRRGSGYDSTELGNLYTAGDARTRIIVKELADKVGDVSSMRALGFCVSVAHAHYMAARFNEAGISAIAVSGDSSSSEREQALAALRRREIKIVFAVDLFNEGLDIPDVDTVLFLRPTESATVFLQQLGRGLRLAPGKTVLTALDFVGHQNKDFRFDLRFRALTGVGGKQLQGQVERGFPFLPSGSQIVLDSVAQDIVLDSIKQQVAPRRATLIAEVRDHPDRSLAGYLDNWGRGLADVLRKDRSWTSLCRDAGKLSPERGPLEADLVKRVRAFAHVDDPVRHQWYRRLLAGEQPQSELELRVAAMLFFSLFPNGGEFDSAAAGLAAVRGEPIVDELQQVVDIAFDAARRSTTGLGFLDAELADVPLQLHASYLREEILAGLGWASQKRTPATMREGVAWCEGINADAFLITLNKSDRDYSPTTMYRDFALSPELFHWESQSTTSDASPTGRRYINHRQGGSRILLFVRATKTDAFGPAPYVFLGPADYVTHEGSRPMAITWRLHRPMPTEIYLGARAAVA